MMDDIRIKRAANGYTVCMCDPEIQKKNRSSDGPYQDPNVEFVFQDKQKLVEFLGTAVDKLPEGDEYSTAFSKAMTEEIDDD